MVRSRNVNAFSAILTAGYNFTRKGRFYGNLISPGTKRKAYVILHVTCTIFFLDLNQNFIFLAKFHYSFHYKISRKSVQWEPRWHMDGRTDRQTDGNDEVNRRFSRLCEKRRIKTEGLQAEFGLLRHILWSELMLRRNGNKWRWHRAVRRVRHVASVGDSLRQVCCIRRR